MNIRVEEIRKLECGAFRGLPTVNVGDFIRISDIRIVQPQGREVLSQMPQRSYQMNDVRRTYSDVIDPPTISEKRFRKPYVVLESGRAHSAPEEPNNQTIAASLHRTLERDAST